MIQILSSHTALRLFTVQVYIIWFCQIIFESSFVLRAWEKGQDKNKNGDEAKSRTKKSTAMQVYRNGWQPSTQKQKWGRSTKAKTTVAKQKPKLETIFIPGVMNPECKITDWNIIFDIIYLTSYPIVDHFIRVNLKFYKLVSYNRLLQSLGIKFAKP